MEKRSLFRTSAVASGLITEHQIREAETAVRAFGGAVDVATEVDDEQLIAKLIELNHLNAWQAEQLKAGRAKFNLGPYRIVDSIGQGGMGQVFKAEHTLMGRVVAVKVLPRHKSTPAAIASFTREIRAQAQLDHENLVRAFDAGHDGNVYFLVTEYVPGTDLRKLVRRRGKLSMTDAATIISQSAEALMHAHSRGLIHRDVKPGNLLVTTAGRTKLLDLGLAGSLNADAQSDPRIGKIVGTADYLSPEHITNPAKISASSDIYSLGCTLYYAVTGKVPFPGGTIRDKARRHCHDTPINPRRLNPDLSEEFVEVIAKMMEKDPAARIPSAEVVIERLAPWAMQSVSTSAAEGDLPEAHTGDSDAIFTPSLSNTHSDLFEPAASSNGRSQASQGTDPHGEATQETLPDFDQVPTRVGQAAVSYRVALTLLLPLVVAGGVLLAAVVIKVFQSP